MLGRAISIPVTIVALCATSLCQAIDAGFPYQVFAVADGVALRSGPGSDYYATQRLPRGEVLQVWRQTADGWLAVRPLKSSYSIVAAKDVRLRDATTAVAVRPLVPVRIGSLHSRDDDAVQVELDNGEVLQVLGSATLAGQAAFRVSPPRGEFRWISSRDVVRPRRPIDLDSKYPVAPPRSPQSTSVEETTRPPTNDAPAQSAANASLRDVLHSLDQVELALATIVAEPSALWDFEHLQTACRRIRDSAEQSEQRRRAEHVLSQIARFEQIRQGWNNLPQLAGVPQDALDKKQREEFTRSPLDLQVTGDSLASAWQPARRSSKDGQVIATSSHPRIPTASNNLRYTARVEESVVRIPDDDQPVFSDGKRYDAKGTLRPVVSRRREAPRFALVDATGDVVAFITPSPGVNLQPYLNDRIGVVGSRGFMPEFKRPHVTVAHVTPLVR